MKRNETKIDTSNIYEVDNDFQDYIFIMERCKW